MIFLFDDSYPNSDSEGNGCESDVHNARELKYYKVSKKNCHKSSIKDLPEGHKYYARRNTVIFFFVSAMNSSRPIPMLTCLYSCLHHYHLRCGRSRVLSVCHWHMPVREHEASKGTPIPGFHYEKECKVFWVGVGGFLHVTSLNVSFAIQKSRDQEFAASQRKHACKKWAILDGWGVTIPDDVVSRV